MAKLRRELSKLQEERARGAFLRLFTFSTRGQQLRDTVPFLRYTVGLLPRALIPVGRKTKTKL